MSSLAMSKKKIPKSVKRILIDIKNYSQNKPHNTFISICNNNVYKIKVLIIGPEDTPYANAFFFIDLEFSNNYPFEPPKAKFKTTNGKIRFNPNLYQDGKVCLSILGTWQGPSWSIVQTMSSVILSIQSLLGEQPLRNEPGYENCKETEDKMIHYNKYVQFHTLNYAIADMIQKKLYPPEFEYVLKETFIKNYESIIKIIENNKTLQNTIVQTSYLQLTVKLDYELVEKKIKELKKTVTKWLKNNEKFTEYDTEENKFQVI